MGRTVQVDPQHLTQRAHRQTRGVGGNDLAGQHTIHGVGATYGTDDAVSAAADAWVRRFANRHNCQAPALLREAVEQGSHNTAEQIRANPAAFCNHPRHAQDAALAAEALEWLGLRPTLHTKGAAKVIAPRTRAARYGTCPACHRSRYLRRDGTVGAHTARDGDPCPGKGTKPAPSDEGGA